MKPINSDIHVPAEIRDLPIFLCWRLEPQYEGDPKPLKMPYYANGGRRAGKQGSDEDRAKLTTYALAKAQAAKRGMTGIGIALLEGHDIVAVDVDNCVVDGKVPKEILDAVGMTYAEYSPSGRGVRALLRGNIGNNKAPTTAADYGFEVFSTSGYVTLTGNMLDHVDLIGMEDRLAPVTPALEALCERRFGARRYDGSPGAPLSESDRFWNDMTPPLGLTVERIEELLATLDPDMGRDEWIRIGMALHHETQGDDTGFELWDEWSAPGVTYPGTEGLRVQWESFTRREGSGRAPITMASVIKMAKEAGGAAARETSAVNGSITRTGLQIAATPYEWRDPKHIPPRPWVFGHWLLRCTVACVVAPGSAGKSTFVSGIAVSCTTGRSFLDKQVWKGPKKVWVWNLEDDLDELSRSIQAACLHHEIAPSDIADWLFVDSAMDGSELCTATEDKDGMRLIEPVYEAVCAEIVRRGIDLLIVDPFVSSHAVEENSNSKIDKVVKAWARVAKAARCVIVLVHHTSKAGAAEVTANSARGASALISAARSVLTLNRMNAADAVKYGISDEDRRRHFAVIDDKHNRAPAERDAWFQLLSVDLGNGDSVGVCVPWQPPAAPKEMDPQMILALQTLVDAGNFRDNPQSSDWVGHAIAQAFQLSLAKASEKLQVQHIQKYMKESRYLEVKYRPNEKGRLTPFVVVGVWIADEDCEDDLF
jgi:hypothetical protein